MLFSSERIQRKGNEFKEFLTERQHEAELTQDAIASELSVKQNTISQYLNPKTDNHLPAFVLPMLPKPLALESLRFLAKDVECVVVPRAEIKGRTDGSLDDELLDIDVIQGDIIKLRKKNLQACMSKLDQLASVIEKMRVEVMDIESKNRDK